MISGTVAPGFEPVREQLEWNVAELGEVGAALAVYRDGVPVVDLWCGDADRAAGRAWEESTLQCIFSGTKGLTAACILILLERELLELEAPVAKYWPEFAAAGKAEITVAQVVSHRSGLPGLREPTTSTEALDPILMADRLAAQAPFPHVLGKVCYHAITYGWLLGELLRRVDGRSIGVFFAEEIARPLGLETWIGLPEEQQPRVGLLVFGAPPVDPPPPAAGFEDVFAATLLNPPVLRDECELWNTPPLWSSEIAAAGGITTARSMARFYACLAKGGELDGVRILSPETVALGRSALVDEPDPLFGLRSSFGVGFALYVADEPGAPSVPGWFGHGGFGGSAHGAWPNERVAFSYVPNYIRQDPAAVPEGIGPGPRLLSALAGCVGLG